MMKKSLAIIVLIAGLAGAVGVYPTPATSGTEFKDCAECPVMVEIPPGKFMMGSPESEQGRFDNEGPVHPVTIPAAFAVGKYEVTFDEWDACVSFGGCKHRPEDKEWGRGLNPVINVTWEDVQEYVVWLSGKTGKTYRLLTEAEWEYVARAGTRTSFHTGDKINTSEANFKGTFEANHASPEEKYRKRTVPAGGFGANRFGLHDVHGNVSEWVKDCYNEDYIGAPSNGDAWTTGNCTRRVLRGGSWLYVPDSLRSAFRDRFWIGSRYDYVGFRVAQTLPR
jgi:formylglycine-generating enzyme required for sulfatase activity